MTNEQFYFYTAAAVTGLVMWGVSVALLRVRNWRQAANNVKDAVKWVGMMAFFSAAFVCVVVPVYVLTRLGDGVQAFIDAALPEVSGLVYRVRSTARHHAAYRFAGWQRSVEYDNVDHRQKMAQFDTDEDAAEENYASAGAQAESTYW